ncbi:MAG: 3'(2'),5'-bisphosphate nucleotidase [Planctomycetota bacterium]|nr:3'(2'),5'-bisphosphate nucleotidase [Planctomycetota bacterium]MDA1164525.1 3'(2'),5'-bisphosphate nucleotidase [Planctomycetota bacterium]
MDGYQKELATAISAVRTAALVTQAVQKQITDDVLEKKDRSPVTIADYASQALICRALKEAFPDDPIVGEEDAAELRGGENAGFVDRILEELAAINVPTTAEEVCSWIDHGNGSVNSRFWTLDPIDGTKGFLRGQQYAISLALIVDGELTVAALGCPNLPLVAADESSPGSLFFAVRGEGAFVFSIEGDAIALQEATRVRTGAATDWAGARLCESVESGHSSHSRSAQITESLGITKAPVRLDSQAKYAVVARGEADIYLRLPTRSDYQEKIWDHAGGALVVQEAGGTVSDVNGKPLDFTRGHELTSNRGVVVSNGPLHDAIVNAVQAAGIS